jgi:hypothetical protein
MGKTLTIGILALAGVSLTGLSVAASTAGWGVDKPKEVKQQKDGNQRTSRRAYYGGYYYPFYRSRGLRSARSGSMRGGGFRSGK